MLIVIYMDTGVQDDFHFKGCSCRLTVTGRVPLVEQKLQAHAEKSSFPHFYCDTCWKEFNANTIVSRQKGSFSTYVCIRLYPIYTVCPRI